MLLCMFIIMVLEITSVRLVKINGIQSRTNEIIFDIENQINRLAEAQEYNIALEVIRELEFSPNWHRTTTSANSTTAILHHCRCT
jgi:hypothetical protein